MAITNPSAKDVKKTTVHMENLSFDPTYEVLTRIPLTLNPISGNLERMSAIQGNGSISLSYDLDGNLQTIEKTIGETTYTKTFTWDGGRLTGVSEWS